jgi:hypothetical protein
VRPRGHLHFQLGAVGEEQEHPRRGHLLAQQSEQLEGRPARSSPRASVLALQIGRSQVSAPARTCPATGNGTRTGWQPRA